MFRWLFRKDIAQQKKEAEEHEAKRIAAEKREASRRQIETEAVAVCGKLNTTSVKNNGHGKNKKRTAKSVAENI